MATTAAVVTGRGTLTAGGAGVSRLLDVFRQGTCLLGDAEAIADPELLGAAVGEIDAFLDAAELRFSRFVRCVVDEAVGEAGLEPRDVAAADVVIGTGSGSRGAEDWALVGRTPPPGAPEASSERFGDLAADLADSYGFAGRLAVVNTACSSGSNALVHGLALIRTGRARRVICVGVDELWAGLVFSFQALGALSRHPCQPYRQLTGTTLAEGAAALVLEDPETARTRDAPCHGSLVGAGQSADAFKLARPDPHGQGAELAIRRALTSVAGDAPAVDVVFGHGTGTATNDEMESALHRRLFDGCRLLGSKGFHGHTVGASGVLETIILLALLNGEVEAAPTSMSPQFPGPSSGRRPRVGVKSAFAMGGLNTALVVQAGEPELDVVPSDLQPVLAVGEITATGSSWLSPDHFDPAAAADRLGLVLATHHDVAITPRQWSRLDLLGRLTYAASAILVERAWRGPFDAVGISYATCQGPVLSWMVAADAVRHGRPLNPKLIPRLSYNAAASSVCQAYGLRGPAVAYTSGASSHRYALEHAIMTLQLGAADAMLVVAADEYTGPEGADDGLRLMSSIDPTDGLFAALHRRLGLPTARPSVTALLLTQPAAAAAHVAAAVEPRPFDPLTSTGEKET